MRTLCSFALKCYNDVDLILTIFCDSIQICMWFSFENGLLWLKYFPDILYLILSGLIWMCIFLIISSWLIGIISKGCKKYGLLNKFFTVYFMEYLILQGQDCTFKLVVWQGHSLEPSSLCMADSMSCWSFCNQMQIFLILVKTLHLYESEVGLVILK